MNQCGKKKNWEYFFLFSLFEYYERSRFPDFPDLTVFFFREFPDLIFSSFDHFPELVQADLVVTGSITGPEDPVSLNLVHVLHHLEEEIKVKNIGTRVLNKSLAKYFNIMAIL